MTLRFLPTYLFAPVFLVLAIALAAGLVLIAGLLALVPALVFAVVLLVIGILDRSRAVTRVVRADPDEGADLAIAILDSLPGPVLLLNLRRKVIATNQAARNLLGENASGRDLALSIRNPDALDAVDAVIAGKGRRTLEISLPVPVQQYFQLHAVKVYRGDGQPDRVIVALTDVTGIRRSEKMRADFVANVSHELRSPLSALVGFIETLQGRARDDPEARERFLGIMSDEAGRMTRIIDDLLSLSQVETSEHIQPEGRIDLCSILQRVAATVELRSSERGMKISVNCPEGMPRVMGDDDELMEVFQNLVVNAIKYGREGTEVTVDIREVERIPEKGGQGVAVAVRNQGGGIEPEHLPRLTERFYRVDKGRSRSIGGTGLGLAIVKHIVNRHRGYLAVESALGEGTIFTVYLPKPTDL